MGGRGSSSPGGGGGGGVAVISAVDGYQKTDYIDINSTLRNPGFDPSNLSRSEVSQKITLLDKATNLTKLRNDQTLYRGLEKNNFTKDLLTRKVGDVFSDKAFVSTSKSRTELTSNDIRLTINAKKGQRGIDVNKINKNGRWKSEHEYILPRNTKFKIRNITTNKQYTEISVDIV